MPHPRKPRPERFAGETRSRRRHIRQCVWLYHQLEERFAYVADLIEQQRQQIAHEKALGHAAEGCSNVVLPGEDPG
ncbi:hypothetical protein [Caulobacter sp. RHG1]|uniref:hypothetical protein n=1 Tax=Caulobacter sp. (strain RHG1) TaxID=2545762 RepID=UPI00155493C3|nr:hypothetical protein [Caulobacter sp. RHG1]NQE61767.1 hypothetical protein [Caulobacter sp. RHG1]